MQSMPCFYGYCDAKIANKTFAAFKSLNLTKIDEVSGLCSTIYPKDNSNVAMRGRCRSDGHALEGRNIVLWCVDKGVYWVLVGAVSSR